MPLRLQLKGLLLISLLMFIACSGSKKVVDQEEVVERPDIKKGVPAITFDTPIKDFGDVKKGEKRDYSFWFTNTGKGPLLIELATACTCTSLDWPRTPVLPGERKSIDIVFDSSTKDGEVSVDVDIISNTEPIVVTAVIKANVISGDK